LGVRCGPTLCPSSLRTDDDRDERVVRSNTVLGPVFRLLLGEGFVLVGAPDEHERPTTGFQNGFEPLKAG
jgi:hypothetical protein